MKKLVSVFLIFIFLASIVPSSVLASRDLTDPQLKAEALKSLNLFNGVSENDFALERTPTRAEALVMFVRLIGDESTVMGAGWSHPFTDVPEWANRYVGYSYLMGHTKGTSMTTFGSNDTAGAAAFLTFVLRALGYSDEAGGDFTWSNPYDLARNIGLLTSNVDTTKFLRADIALIAWNALSLPMKGGNKALSDILIMGGVFTRTQYDSATASVKNGNTGTTAVKGVNIGMYACSADSSGFTYEQDYRPTVTLRSDMSCTVSVNMGAGMATGAGTWNVEKLDTGEIGIHITITAKSWADSYSYSFIYFDSTLSIADGGIGITPVDSVFKLTKTAATDFGTAVNMVSATFEGKLTALTSGGKAVSSAAVMSGIYDAARTLVDSGTIKNLAYNEQGVFFTYTDGTPGGVVMDLPDLATTAASTLSSTSNPSANNSLTMTNAVGMAGRGFAGSALTALANTAAVATNVIGNNKVLLSINLNAVSDKDFETYEALANKFKSNTRGLAVTVKDLTVADYRTLNTYGAVFISNPTSWMNDGVSCIELAEDYDASKNYDTDRHAGRIGVFSKISPGATKYIAENDGYILSSVSFDYDLRYVLFPEKFFSYYYGSAGSFPNSFIHLGFDSSISGSKLSNLLVGAGAGCVTGYTDTMRRQPDFKVIGTLMDTFLKADKNTVYDAYLSVLDNKLGTDTFAYSYYKNLKWDIASRNVNSLFDMRLKNANGDLKLWGTTSQAATGTGLTLSNCTYSTATGSFGTTKYNVKGTITNNTNDSISSVYCCEDVVFDPKIDSYLEGYLCINFGTNSYLQPGESRNFELTKELLKDTGYFELVITDYYTKAGTRVKIPVADYVQVPCTKT